MHPAPAPAIAATPPSAGPGTRLDYLDATRAFALVLGVVFHASMSFSPYFMGWAVQDISTSPIAASFFQISHSFRMETFFLLAGFFSHDLLQRRGPGGFVRSRVLRLGIPLVAGWFLLRPLLISGWIMGAASMRGDYHFWPAVGDGFATLKTLPAGIFTGSHLWFLYYLILVTGLVLVVRAIANRVRFPIHSMDVAADWLSRSSWALVPLVIPTAATLWFMRYWAVDTPDQSLRPDLPVLMLYCAFFGLGWLFARQPEAIARFGRLAVPNVVLALASGWAVLRLSEFQSDPGHPQYAAAHVGFVASYATLMWTLVALSLGFFRKFLHEPRPAVRYLADSSYWMYLVHLPVVVWLQVAVAEVNLPWWVKLPGISVATVFLALVTYDLFVRSTFLGWLLSGRRRERVLFRTRVR